MPVYLVMGALLMQSSTVSVNASSRPKCTVEGQVVNAASGAPLKRANLRLQPVIEGKDIRATRTTYTSSTDAEGKFVLQDVNPGTYMLRADRAGYIAQSYGSRSVSGIGSRLKLDPGQSMKDLQIKLVPQAMVFGKVIDDDGEAVAGVRIQMQRLMFFNGKKQWSPYANGTSQADGTFVLGGIPSGKYYLSAETFGDTGSYGEIESAAGKSGRESFLKTYFPNALDIASAAPLDIGAGAELRGVEIRMRRGRVYEIRGRVVNTTPVATPANVSLVISPKNSDRTVFDGRSQAFAGGKDLLFQFKNLLPGTYVIQSQFAQSVVTDPATGEAALGKGLTGRIEVTIGDANLNDVVFPLGTGVEIIGSIKTETDSSTQVQSQQTSQTPRSATIQLRATGGVHFAPPYAQASSEGNFRLHAVAPDVYRVTVYGNPDGTYVKAIRFGGQDITGKDLDLTSGGGGELEILLSPNPADISGIVRAENGEAVSGILVQLFLGDEVKATVNTDQYGAFHMSNLAPGDYWLYAWEDIEPGLSQEPSLRKAFESKATSIKLKEKSRESLEVKLIAKDLIEAEAAKIR